MLSNEFTHDYSSDVFTRHDYSVSSIVSVNPVEMHTQLDEPISQLQKDYFPVNLFPPNLQVYVHVREHLL